MPKKSTARKKSTTSTAVKKVIRTKAKPSIKAASPQSKVKKSVSKPIAKKATPKVTTAKKSAKTPAKKASPAKAKTTSVKAKKVTEVKAVKKAKPIAKPVKKTTKPAAKKSISQRTSQVTAKKTPQTVKKSQSIAKNTGKKTPSVAKSKPVARNTPSNKIETVLIQVKEVNRMGSSSRSDVFDLTKLDFQPYRLGDTEDYMNAAQLEHFQSILLKWKQSLMEQVDETVNHMQNEQGNLADPSDCATREEEFNLELRTRDRERQLIKKIETALQQINHNEYGYCTQCGEEIGVRRLEARPTANLCIDCKTLAEIREKHYSN